MRHHLAIALVLAGTAHAGPSVRLNDLDPDAAKLEHLRVAGTRAVIPDRATLEHVQPGDYFSAELEFCVDTEGRVNAARVAEGTAYGKTVVEWTRAWRFKPLLKDGKAVAACGRESIHYQVPLLGHMRMNLAPTVFESLRASGATDVPLSASVRAQIKRTTSVLFKVCIDEHGAVEELEVLHSSGLPDLDRELDVAIRRWTYRPYQDRYGTHPVCTAISFIERGPAVTSAKPGSPQA